MGEGQRDECLALGHESQVQAQLRRVCRSRGEGQAQRAGVLNVANNYFFFEGGRLPARLGCESRRR